MPPDVLPVLTVGLPAALRVACAGALRAAGFTVLEAGAVEEARALLLGLRLYALVIGSEVPPDAAASLARDLRGAAVNRDHPFVARLDGERSACGPSSATATEHAELFDVCLPFEAPDGAAAAVADLLRFVRLQATSGRLVARLLDSAPDPILTVDASGRIVLVNEQAEAVFGYPRRDLLGRPVELLVPAPHATAHVGHRHHFAADPRTRPMGHRQTLLARHRDGHDFPVEVSLAPLGIDGESFVTAAVRDVTERRRMEQEVAAAQAARLRADALRENVAGLYRAAREASRLKDDFLATLSHELRTPLNVVLGWTRLLRGGEVDSETRERALAAVERNSQMLADLVSQLLDVSRIVTGKLRLERRPTDLAALLASAVDSIRPAAEGKDVALSLHVQPGLEPILADANRLLQVLWNLLTNAVKFTPGGGRVDVSADAAGGGVRIAVADTGAGIAPGFLPFVFDRFRQAGSAETRAHGGLGLGLSIVRDLVEAHGGTVSAESAGTGRGATFVVELPGTERAGALPETTSALPAPPPLLEGLRILAVDDEADARDLLAAALQGQGASVVVAASAHEALDAFERLTFDGVVADIGLPGEDGNSLMRKLRAMTAGGSVAAVAVTARARLEDEVTALASGFQRYLPKPIDPQELADTLADLIGRSSV
jgi:PAS domain S-box-containing protein